MEKKKIEQILFGNSIEDKLTSLDLKSRWQENHDYIFCPEAPGEVIPIKNPQKLKFPSANKLMTDEGKAMALHFFANHELQAINMMCAALLIFPHNSNELIRFKRGLYKSIIDEQKHFSLYIKRMKDYGLNFGEFSQSDFFWRQMQNIKSPEHFCSVMALTLENANLDFSLYYKEVFEKMGDQKTAEILKVVLEDEIDHVRIGYRWLKTAFQSDDMWKLYKEILPFPMTPSRAKGDYFNLKARIDAGLDMDFINSLKSHKDEFKVVNRKKWK